MDSTSDEINSDEIKAYFRGSIMAQRRRGKSYEEAARLVAMLSPAHRAVISAVMVEILEETRKNRLLDRPLGALRRLTEEEARLANWYAGPEDGDEAWPRLLRNLQRKLPESAVENIDRSSTKVVANLADPNTTRLKNRGLVIGHVQSGKTANYSAVLAKASDTGYRLVIVLAGVHNNLRRQTQQRLEDDLGTKHKWVHMTTEDADFGGAVDGSALMDRGTNILCVVKKNSHRLRRLRDWLSAVPEDIRLRCPAIIIDDEADQATPNTLAARNEVSAINQLVRDVWGLLPSGSYVAYTATPFANVFMDPNDGEELYPADFIIDLPESDEYFGAERIFGRHRLEDAADPDPGLNMVREVPDDEANSLKPPTRAADKSNFEATVPPSLADALRWFLTATAIRKARGQDSHSSMLVHTTHFVDPHFKMQQEILSWLDNENALVAQGDLSSYETLWQKEHGAAAEVATFPMPSWSDITELLPAVLKDVRVVVDNGLSEDRLNYSRLNDDGTKVMETVIAIGGGTLSRGLTLEGLVVSYFTRNSNSYDTLLQMGRWFGYRPGYEDLPRVWMPNSMAADFEFLATVEAELRLEIQNMQREEKTPAEVGVRIRSHPGRLTITSAAKMAHTEAVQISLSGTLQQTVKLIEKDRDSLESNLSAASALVDACLPKRCDETKATALFMDVGYDLISRFLHAYAHHEDQGTLRATDVDGWVEKAISSARWNVAVIGRRTKDPDLGTQDLGRLGAINTINRSPLRRESSAANLKALISQPDRLSDISPSVLAAKSQGRSPEAVRAALNPDDALLLLYPISRFSTPNSMKEEVGSRRPMKAPLNLIGYAINFPYLSGESTRLSHNYYAVQPTWTPTVEDEEELFPRDTESDATPRIPR